MLTFPDYEVPLRQKLTYCVLCLQVKGTSLASLTRTRFTQSTEAARTLPSNPTVARPPTLGLLAAPASHGKFTGAASVATGHRLGSHDRAPGVPKRSVIRGGEQRVRERRANSRGGRGGGGGHGKQRERLTVPECFCLNAQPGWKAKKARTLLCLAKPPALINGIAGGAG